MTGVIVFLKQESHSDDVISSRPQESEESFCHSFLHLMHFTRILFMPFPRSELSSLYYVTISIMAGKIKGYRTSNRGNKLEKNTRVLDAQIGLSGMLSSLEQGEGLVGQKRKFL